MLLARYYFTLLYVFEKSFTNTSWLYVKSNGHTKPQNFYMTKAFAISDS